MTETVRQGLGNERVTALLRKSFLRPPKVLLLEGGTADERLRTALHWAAGVNCPAEVKPCHVCALCSRISMGESADVRHLDGREGRIGIDAVRELRPLLGQAPRDKGKRVIILGEAQELTPEAANALLKFMEDTDPRNYFMLLAPQRERLLPTLVSRSWVFNLGWTRAHFQDDGPTPQQALIHPDADAWVTALAEFLRTGRGWFARTMVKAAVDRSLVAAMISACRRDLLQAMHQRPMADLAVIFSAQSDPVIWRSVDLRLQQAESALMAQIAPGLILDWLAVGLRMALDPVRTH